jgi:hypothetical protein
LSSVGVLLIGGLLGLLVLSGIRLTSIGRYAFTALLIELFALFALFRLASGDTLTQLLVELLALFALLWLASGDTLTQLLVEDIARLAGLGGALTRRQTGTLAGVKVLTRLAGLRHALATFGGAGTILSADVAIGTAPAAVTLLPQFRLVDPVAAEALHTGAVLANVILLALVLADAVTLLFALYFLVTAYRLFLIIVVIIFALTTVFGTGLAVLPGSLIAAAIATGGRGTLRGRRG